MPRRGGRPSRQYLEDTKRMQEKRKLREVGMLTGGQAKIAAKAPPTNKIDAKDFAVLRAEKAKGRGMGLQDEKVKPGKVMKARVGKSMKKDPTKTVNPFEKKSSQSMGRRKALGTVKSSLKVLGKAGKVGAAIAALGVAGAGAAKLGQTIGRKMTEKKNKKMGGGMMKRPAMKKGGMSAGDKFNAKVKGMLDTYDDKNTPMKKDRFKEKLKAKGKMGGGMMMQRPMMVKKGGGADTGRKGEFMSKLGVAINKIKRDRPTRPDLKKLSGKMAGGMMKKPIMAREGRLASYAKKKGLPMPLVKKPKFKNLGKMPFIKGIGKKDISKKMGGGMMKQKPMGYKKGSSENPMKEERFQRTRQAAIAKAIGKENVGDPRKVERPSKKNRVAPVKKTYMAGGMMNKPMGYKAGKSVKAKCKLGRNKPTKMY
jgi:hypothetical protein